MNTTGIHFIEDFELADKTVLLRVDFNVPVKDGVVTDDNRIRAALPTIVHAVEAGAKVILCSHFGRPSGHPDPKYSLEPVAARLAEILDTETLLYDTEVFFPESVIGDDVREVISEMRGQRQVMLLENLRFHPGEKSGDDEFAKELASLADFYINDAFGACHRKHASVYTINKYFDRHHRGVGYLIKSELEGLSRLLDRPPRPYVAIVGGAKVSDKLGVLNALIDKVDSILVGGAMAYTFLGAQGHGVGKSLVESDFMEEAKKIIDKAKARGVDLVLPVDHRVAETFDASKAILTDGVEIGAEMMGLDIGPKTQELFEQILSEGQTIFWNGPLGVFENPAFAEGTLSVARALAASDAYTVIGGGDSVAAAAKAEVLDKFGHVSTGGGASLQIVEGKTLPGIESLRPNHPFD